MTPSYLLPLLASILIIGSVIGIAFLATLDAKHRGFSDLQIFLLRVAIVFSFPVVLVAYLIFRPSLRECANS